SISATEHSVMTSYESELASITKSIQEYGDKFVSIVMDSYDYKNALENLLPAVKSVKLKMGGYLVIRPDSGDIVKTVLDGLKACDLVFGSELNELGYKVLNNCSVIQGDGVTFDVIHQILQSVEALGFSAQNVVFGMGGGLLQKVNRDTMSFATKLSMIESKSGVIRNIMKKPKTDSGKFSLPGAFKVYLEKDENGLEIPKVYPRDSISADHPEKNSSHSQTTDSKNILRIVYDNGPVPDIVWDDFDTIKQRIENQWASRPAFAKVLSDEIETLRR
ncbi:hypothetical protein AYI69_g9894, partial [Smittium culicis]